MEKKDDHSLEDYRNGFQQPDSALDPGFAPKVQQYARDYAKSQGSSENKLQMKAVNEAISLATESYQGYPFQANVLLQALSVFHKPTELHV